MYRLMIDSYVNDGVTVDSGAEVERMKGERLGDGSYSGNLAKILNLGKLKMKVVDMTMT